ncbi:MAG: hypothetical protein KAT37_01330 [Candidatus Aenigmarchaeota archaeon]|nr:hypothetical protein [Candidatus Aenigmarchaeota archaeon]
MALKGILAVLGVVFLLAPVVFISGCVEGGGFQSIFSSLTGGGETIVAPKDVLLVRDILVIPNPPITASSSVDSTFTLTFQVVNIGETQEGAREAENVHVIAYDWGRCRPMEADGETTISPEPDEIYGIGENPEVNLAATIYPGGGAEIVQWSFKAPTNTELGRMEGICPIRFKVVYEFDAHTTSDISIVARDRLVDASRAGETLSVSPVQTQSRGPIKISVDFETSQPVDENLIIPVIIKIYDTGSGMYESVPVDGLEVQFPNAFEIISCHPTSWMSWSDGEVTNSIGKIPLIKGESPPIRCDLSFIGSIEDIKTYNVRAYIKGYEYPLYEEKDVTIKPTYTTGDDEGSNGGDGGNGGNGDSGDGDGDSGDEETSDAPDLVILRDQFRFSPDNPVVGEEVTFWVPFQNSGELDAVYEGGIKLAYFEDPRIPTYIDVGTTLEAGSTYQESFKMTFDEPGDHMIFAHIDEPDDVEEKSEYNNFWDVKVPVSSS